MKLFWQHIISLLKNFFKKGFFHLLSANVLIQLFAFASQLFVAGILSPDDVGRIKIIQTYFAIFSIIAGLGFNSSTLKICSETRTEEETAKYFINGFLFTIISSTSVYLTIIILNHFRIFSTDKLITALIPIGLFPLISNSLFSVLMSYFQAKKSIKLLSKHTILNKILSIIGIIVLSYYFGIKGYYVAFNLSLILMVIVAFFSARKNHPFTFNFDKQTFSEHWKYARSSTFANIVSEISAYVDILLISFLIKDMQQIGYYSLALTTVTMLRLFPSTAHQITTPYFSSLQSNKEEFIKLFKTYNRLLLLIIGISLILFILVMPTLVDWIFSQKYHDSIPFLLPLSIGWSIRSSTYLQSAAIFGLGKIHYNAYTALCALIGNIIIYPIAICFWGLMGAAYASISSGIIIWIASKYYLSMAVRKTRWEAA